MTETAASALIRSSFAWDNHACMPLRPADTAFLPQIERARAAGFDAVTINIGFGQSGPDEHFAMLASMRAWFGARPQQYRLIERASDLDDARAEGRLGILFDIEGACAIADRLDLVERFYAGGVRWMLIAYNRANLAGAGCLDTEDGGLTAFGRAMIAEMNRVGMTVCCTHTGHRTAMDVLEAAQAPVIFSHSNCSAVYQHPRNIPNTLIRACAETGGVVGINGLGDFLGPRGADLDAAIVAHIDHAVSLVGPEHVGIALDYVYDREELLEYFRTHKDTLPADMDETLPMIGPEGLTNIVERLIGLGYPETAIRQILGGNWRRVADVCWRPVDAAVQEMTDV